jgi:hypothetical protein
MDWANVISFFLGIISTLLITFVSQLIIFWLNRKAAKEERDESFKLKLFELRLQAAQTAYQYVLRVYRAYKVPSKGIDPKKLRIEARDWLDSQALILGKKVYETVIFYFFALENKSLSDQEHAKELVKAEKALESVFSQLDRHNEKLDR